MKRLLLGAALTAISASTAFGQVHEEPKKAESSGSGDTVHADLYYVPDIEGEIITVSERIGTAYRDTLTTPSSVITSDEIAARGQQFVSDLLRSLPGIAVNSSGPAGGLTQIRVRGAEANQVLILIDGVEVANPSSGEFDFAGLRSEDIVRIETCLLYTSPSPRDATLSRMPSSA